MLIPPSPIELIALKDRLRPGSVGLNCRPLVMKGAEAVALVGPPESKIAVVAKVGTPADQLVGALKSLPAPVQVVVCDQASGGNRQARASSERRRQRRSR